MAIEENMFMGVHTFFFYFLVPIIFGLLNHALAYMQIRHIVFVL